MSLVMHSQQAPTHVTAKAGLQYIRAELNTTFARMKTAHAELYRRVWLAKDYTPTEFFAAAGKDGVEVLRVLEALADAVERIRPNTIPEAMRLTPAGVLVRELDDGSVLIA